MGDDMTPQDWDAALRPEATNPECDAFVALVVRAHLAANVMLDDIVSTTELVQQIYPIEYARASDNGMEARHRLFKCLIRLAKGDLKDCTTRGPVQKLGKYRKPGHPILWHPPHPVAICEKCGRPI